MFFLTKPDTDVIREILNQQQPLDYSYPAVGETVSGTPKVPDGFSLTHHRALLGNGDVVFRQAKTNLSQWKIFDLPWLEFHHQTAELTENSTVGILIRNLGIWSFNPCKIIRIIDTSANGRQFGFSYGTLPAHAVGGEERFLIEQLADGAVYLDIMAFSRPRHILAWLGYPVLRMQQKRFAPQASRLFKRSLSHLSPSR